MHSAKISYHYLIAILLFFVCIVLSILFQSYILIVVPFAWILLPIAFDFCIKRTEDLFWVFIFVIPLSTELNITTSLGIDFPDELGMMLLTGLFFLKTLHQPKWFPSNLKKEPLFLILVCILSWTCISACFASNSLLSIKFILAKLWYIVPFVIMPQWMLRSETNIKKLTILLLAPMLFVVIQTLVRHAYYGFSFVDIKKTVFPFFRNHVNYSSMLVCLLAPAFAFRTMLPKENVYKKWLSMAILIGLVGLFFSYSRGAWVALIIGISMAFLIKWNWVKRMSILVLSLFIMASSWLLVEHHYMRFAPDHDHTIFHTDFSEHIAATINMKDVSNAERFYRWVAGLRMFIEKPVTGFGPNNFYANYRPYTLNAFETWVSDNPEHSTIHNYFLLTLSEQGVPGLFLLLLLWLAMLFRLQYLYNKLQHPFYRMVAMTVAVVLAMIFSINFMSDMIETDKIGSLFWLCLSFVFVLNRKLEEEYTSIA